MSTKHFPFEQLQSTPILDRPTAEEFDVLALRDAKPILLKGCLEDWPLYRELSRRNTANEKLDWLNSLIGHRRIHYTTIPPQQCGHLGFSENLDRQNFTLKSSRRKTRFVDYSAVLRERLLAPELGTVCMLSVKTFMLPELELAAPELPYFSKLRTLRRGVWIGSGGRVANLHFDPLHNMIATVEGKRRVVLFPPECTASLYPSPLDRGLGGAVASRARLLDADFERFPRLGAAMEQGYVAECEPGDLLYIPPLWWHHLETFGLNVMINSWIHAVTLSDELDLKRNIVRGIALYDATPEAISAHYARRYRSLLLGSSTDGSTQSNRDIDTRENAISRKAERHFFELKSMLPRLSIHLRIALWNFYEYWVFHPGNASAPFEGAEAKRVMRHLAWFVHWVPIAKMAYPFHLLYTRFRRERAQRSVRSADLPF